MLPEQHLHASTHTLEIVDLVFHQQHVRHTKLDLLFEGTHRIIQNLHGHKWKIYIS